MKSLRATELIVCASFIGVKTGPLAVINPAKYLPSLGRWQLRPRGPEEGNALMAQFEFLGNGLIPIDIGILQVIQKPTPLTDHH